MGTYLGIPEVRMWVLKIPTALKTGLTSSPLQSTPTSVQTTVIATPTSMQTKVIATPTSMQTKVIATPTSTQTTVIARPTTSESPPACTTPGAIWVSPKDGAEMVCVPAGEFTMGSYDGKSDEQPVRQFYLDAFWLDKTEVTNGQFSAFVRDTGYKTKTEKEGKGLVLIGSFWEPISGANWQHPEGPNSSITGKAKHPVVLVSWADAVTYCQWAGKRLPTEAEWEKAAGWDPKTKVAYKWPWGNTWDSRKANTVENELYTTTTVGSYPTGASPYGAMDMAGNVWEWVADWYDASYDSKSPYRNPQGPVSGQYHTLRGGGWYNDSSRARVANRGSARPPREIDGNFGFRCAQ